MFCNAQQLPVFGGSTVRLYPPSVEIISQGLCASASLEHCQQPVRLLRPMGQPGRGQIGDALQGVSDLLLLVVIQFSGPSFDAADESRLAGCFPALRVRIEVLLDGILLTLRNILGEVPDLRAIEARKQRH